MVYVHCDVNWPLTMTDVNWPLTITDVNWPLTMTDALEMALLAAHLNAELILVVTVRSRDSSPSHTTRDNSLLKRVYGRKNCSKVQH